MNDNIKTIKINKDFLNIVKTKKNKTKKNKTKKNISNIKSNNIIKKKLIERIKEHQNNINIKEPASSKNKVQEKINDNFNESLNYLKNIVNKNKIKKRQRKEKKINKTISNKINKTISNKIRDDPPYGILKNGNKPTWRTWNKTIKEKNDKPIEIEINDKPIEIEINDKPIEIEINDKPIEIEKNDKPVENVVKRKKTKKIKYKLGKNDGKVSVIIKNSRKIKEIENDFLELKKCELLNIKRYLKRRNLLKIGNNVPDDILRELYENCIKTGDVNNISSNYLLHNYFTKVEK